MYLVDVEEGGGRPGAISADGLPPASVDEAAAVDVELGAGDVSAHHPAPIHGSGPNTSDRPRRALVARYHPPTTRVTTGAWPSARVLRPAAGGL